MEAFPRLRCDCACHQASAVPPFVGFNAFFVSDVIEAAVACDSCRDAHCEIFLAPVPPRRVLTPEQPKDYAEDEPQD